MSLVMIKTKKEIVQVASDYDGPAKTVDLEPKYVRESYVTGIFTLIFVMPHHPRLLFQWYIGYYS